MSYIYTVLYIVFHPYLFLLFTSQQLQFYQIYNIRKYIIYHIPVCVLYTHPTYISSFYASVSDILELAETNENTRTKWASPPHFFPPLHYALERNHRRESVRFDRVRGGDVFMYVIPLRSFHPDLTKVRRLLLILRKRIVVDELHCRMGVVLR